MTAAQKLAMARALIEDPKHWTRGVLVRASPDGHQAFCALGACLEVGAPTGPLRKQCAPLHVSTFNDVCSHTEVLALFDRAIELAS